tara:strand:- start:1598 stop:2023 length:426 start_codon:yes stop_codon:yes gene_type:complete
MPDNHDPSRVTRTRLKKATTSIKAWRAALQQPIQILCMHPQDHDAGEATISNRSSHPEDAIEHAIEVFVERCAFAGLVDVRAVSRRVAPKEETEYALQDCTRLRYVLEVTSKGRVCRLDAKQREDIYGRSMEVVSLCHDAD